MAELIALLPIYALAHLQVSLAALAVGVSLCVPLGVLAARRPALGRPLLAAAGVVQTIPSLALLALMVPLLAACGLTSIGFLPAFLALILYCGLPILRNTVTGLQSVEPSYLEAAAGLGMTPGQALIRVELPLALPTILAGVRTAVVWTVGVATLSTPVGATSLGNFIFTGLQTRNHLAILVGCGAAAAMALGLDGLVVLTAEAWRRRGTWVIGAGALWAGLSAASLGPVALRALHDDPPTLRVGAKTFTEQYVLAEILALQIETRTARDTEVRGSLGSTIAFDALVAGDIDVYVDYTGTLWTTVLGRSAFPDRRSLGAEVAASLRERYGVEMVAPLGFDNTYALAVPRRRATAEGLGQISDLGPRTPTWTLGADYEFFGRPEWAALRRRYNLTFGQLLSMDASLTYEAASNGDVDVICAFSTDGRLEAFDLEVLDDDLKVMPPYDAVILVSEDLATRHPRGHRRPR